MSAKCEINIAHSVQVEKNILNIISQIHIFCIHNTMYFKGLLKPWLNLTTISPKVVILSVNKHFRKCRYKFDRLKNNWQIGTTFLVNLIEVVAQNWLFYFSFLILCHHHEILLMKLSDFIPIKSKQLRIYCNDISN